MENRAPVTRSDQRVDADGGECEQEQRRGGEEQEARERLIRQPLEGGIRYRVAQGPTRTASEKPVTRSLRTVALSNAWLAARSSLTNQ